MWLINFLPNWIFHLLLIGGIGAVIAAQVFKFIPVVSKYRLPILVSGIVLAAVGLFMEGAISNEEKWQLKVAEAEKRALAAEAKSAQENTKLVTKTVEKIKLIQDVQVVVQKEIVEKATVIDAECKVPREAVTLHNKAATRPEGLK